MRKLYEEYYKEITDSQGRITNIEFTYDESFNFAYDVMDRFAAEMPDKVALVHKSTHGEVKRYTFGDIKELTDKAAVMLQKQGIGHGDSVLLLLKRRFEFWISILALHKLGAVAIPTSHMVSAEDISDRLELAHSKMVICVGEESICDKVKEAIAGKKITVLVVGDEYKDELSFNTLLKSVSDPLIRVKTKTTDPMLYYFTSGTNGAPKAVIHDYAYPIAHIYTAKVWHGVKEGDLHLTVADSGWAKSAWGKLYGQWFMGASIMVYDYEQFYAGDMLKLIEEEGINTFCAPPTIYKYLVKEDLKAYKLNNLRYVTTAGESMPAEVEEKFRECTGLEIRTGFGQTETVLQICTPVYEKQVKGSIGYKVPFYDMKIVDEDGIEVPCGEEGEIVIVPKDGKRPMGIFAGYLGDEDLYKEVWEGGVYHTKDKAFQDKNGNFYYVGRNDDVIKSSGYRIGPSEVEDVLMRHPAVFECAVTGYPSKNRGAIVKASIILNKGYAGDGKLKTELQEFVKSRTAIYKYPRKVEFVTDLPRTVTGKISRAKIRARDYHRDSNF